MYVVAYIGVSRWRHSPAGLPSTSRLYSCASVYKACNTWMTLVVTQRRQNCHCTLVYWEWNFGLCSRDCYSVVDLFCWMMNRCHSWAKMICVCLMVVKVMVCWHDNMSFVITTDKSDFYNLSVIIYEDCCIHLMALKLRLHPIFCNLKTMFCFLFMFLFLFTSVPYRVNMNKTKVMMSGERQKVR